MVVAWANGFAISLKNFLDIWRSRFPQLGYPTQLSDPTGWQTLPLQTHSVITLAYNSPGVKPDTNFDWKDL